MQSWLRSTIAQFGMSVAGDLRRLFPEDGAALVRLSEAQFADRLPQVSPDDDRLVFGVMRMNVMQSIRN